MRARLGDGEAEQVADPAKKAAASPEKSPTKAKTSTTKATNEEPAKKAAASPEKSPTKAKTSTTKATKKRERKPVGVVAATKKAKHGEAVVDDAKAQAEKPDYAQCTVKQLLKTLKDKGLKTKGHEHVLVARMQGAE
jgi:hypothetical protein